MKEHNIDGHIFNINSIAGHYVLNYPRIEVYTATKHAVTALTELMRKQWQCRSQKSGLRPGLTDTEMIEDAKKLNLIKDTSPVLYPEDIADAVEYALSTPPHVQVHEIMIRPTGDAL
ncbi:unnamed protein product [Acanthoscelides obtectus]|uniref:Uncharacterized protein n=1 Tax=Acanthoscelides obtectus TaxID=200917 RepID=A0A9P0M772_ACAOB|nr:unnamed protein product [Acanthoscelides obtectus]CAK1661034.1 Farnesol dehydrogenase [Acanthoscelides obtectus]